MIKQRRHERLLAFVASRTDPEVRKRGQQEAVRRVTLLRGEDIAAIVYVVTQPEHVNISEILICSTEQV